MTTITRLRVGDEAFLVASMIERCPRSMMIRELLKNAQEAAAEAPAPRVEFSAITVEGARKLVLWNTGRGLTAEELYRMCDIASSVNKRTGLDGNFGMGAKVASLPSNQHGMRYRSCRDGVVHQVILGKRDGIYGRVHQPGADGRPTEIIDATAAARAEGRDIGLDWTEVVLLGNRADQDTVADPYDGHPRSGPAWLVEAIGARFFRFPAGQQVMLAPGLAGQPGRYALRSAAQRLAALPHYERVALPAGVAIHYAYDAPAPDRPGVNASHASGLESAEGMGGVVFQNEIYGALRAHHWRREAPGFGVPTGARHVSILVELPDGFPVQAEGYREALRHRGGVQPLVRMLDFAAQVAENLPLWLKAILAENSPAGALAEEVQRQMAALLEEMGVVRRRPPRQRLSDRQAPAAPRPPGPPQPPGAAPAPTFESAPDLILLRSPGEIADAGLAHRAACYYPESHQLHVNMAYPAVPRLAAMLTGSAPGEETHPAMQAAAQSVAERAMVLRVARALVHALDKRGRPAEWNDVHMRTLMSPESLTLAADDIHTGLPEAREGFRAAMAEGDAAD
ncbi:ATP-binding protein [Roseomonas sp. CECT 9278]|uniref:ATP-binding protein n=1 Tax=Roseomonas sp. CECT 9278 TaxID=2845823 RepID=UPI001E4DC084|nr:ATP-binding protein [Roseomonas sp. CECT 9278]